MIIPRPTITGVFCLVITGLAFTAGYLRRELVIILLGTAFFSVESYCFLALFISNVLFGRKVREINIEIITGQIRAGEQAELRIRRKPRFFVIPGIFFRYMVRLATADNRIATCIFDPVKTKNQSGAVFSKAPVSEKFQFINFPVKERGAYFKSMDELYIMDAPGFFRIRTQIHREQALPLLAVPLPARKPILFVSNSGGDKRSEINYRKTDNLTENRPYIPGDDPRRINWKLYGHGPESELYVREGENAPLPHSRLLILLDTQIDPVLYSTEEDLSEIDRLCENALAIIQEYGQRFDIWTGYTGGKILPASASALAWPAALPLLSDQSLPDASDDTGILVLALPRISAGKTALDRFITLHSVQKHLDLIFLYSPGKNAEDRREAARICTAFYRRKNNVFPRSVELPQ